MRAPLRWAYAHLNLRHNPFGELPPDERAEVAVVEVGAWLERLGAGRFALQVLGEPGRGKTTHLLALRAELPEATYRHVGEDEHLRAADVAPGRPTMIDECQRLRPRVRRRIFAREGALVIGSHADHTPELVRAGYAVETVRPASELSVKKLAQMFEARIEHARRSPGPVPRIRAETLQALVAEFGTHVRAMEHALYERFQRLTEVADV